MFNLYEKHNSYNRMITDLAWSPHIPDLLLASYSQNEEGTINDPVSLIMLWSLSLKTRPEYTLVSPSFITSACFDPFANNLIIGGLYSGQLLLWDLRAKSAPSQRTSITAQGHAHPVYSVFVVGSQNAHNIVSLSNDGRLCVWNLAQLSAPQKTLDLKAKPGSIKQQQDINVTCARFPEGDPNNFYFGSEDGNLFLSQIHSKYTACRRTLTNTCLL